ncbi:hypothetical protein IL306_011884 [Fusarium sp. DS 682]|nr:hypothetical protein IL306_011884 [Fusarium sp. DS 682]
MRDSTSPASTSLSDGDASWLGHPVEVLTDLVNIFFAKIQGWLPLLHRPRFFNRFMKNDTFIKRNYSDTEALLLCGMFALAARHSTHPQFQDIPAPDRGQVFEEQVRTDLRASLMRRDNDTSFEERFALFYPPRVSTANSDKRSDVQSDNLGGIVEELRRNDKDLDENGSDRGQLLQPSDLGDSETLMAELASLSGQGFSRYMQDGQQDWSEGLSLDYLGDDHQHLNYLQL